MLATVILAYRQYNLEASILTETVTHLLSYEDLVSWWGTMLTTAAMSCRRMTTVLFRNS